MKKGVGGGVNHAAGRTCSGEGVSMFERSWLGRGVMSKGEEGKNMVVQGLVDHYKEFAFACTDRRPLESVKLGSDMI